MFSEPYSSSMPQTLQSRERDVHLWPSLTILPLQTPPVRARGTTIHLVSTKSGSIPLFEHQPDLEVVVYIAGLRKGSVHELGEIRGLYHPWPSPIDGSSLRRYLVSSFQAVLVLLTGKQYIMSAQTIHILFQFLRSSFEGECRMRSMKLRDA